MKLGLNRAEFIEILVRMAIRKYVDPKKIPKPTNAFAHFLTQDVLCKD